MSNMGVRLVISLDGSDFLVDTVDASGVGLRVWARCGDDVGVNLDGDGARSRKATSSCLTVASSLTGASVVDPDLR